MMQLANSSDQVSVHQSNYATLTRLHQTTAALSEQTTQILTQLAKTRQELIGTPATDLPADNRDVPYSDLLMYAKRISKFTVPPTVRAASSPAAAAARAQEQEERSPEKQVATPGDQNEGSGDVSMKDVGTPTSGAASTPDDQNAKTGVVLTSSPPEEAAQPLDPIASLPFSPWPTEETIRRGALARIQAMLETGKDPASVVDAPPPPGGVPTNADGMAAAQAPPGAEEASWRQAGDDTGLSLDRTNERGDSGRGDISMGLTNSTSKVESERSNAQHNEKGDKNGGHENGPPGEQTTEKDEEKEKVEESPAVFGGLDLYDPDDE